MKRLSKAEAIAKFGEKYVKVAMESNAEPTSRVMYPSFENPSHLDKVEYSGEPVNIDGCKLPLMMKRISTHTIGRTT